jgi:hypothetical protein
MLSGGYFMPGTLLDFSGSTEFFSKPFANQRLKEAQTCFISIHWLYKKKSRLYFRLLENPVEEKVNLSLNSDLTLTDFFSVNLNLSLTGTAVKFIFNPGSAG